MLAGFEAVADGNAFVKHKTRTLPATLVLRHGFKVFKNAAFEVKNFFKALGAHEGGRFFAAYAAGAKHRNFGKFSGDGGELAALGHLAFYPAGKLRKTGCGGVDGARKGSDGDLIVVARVDQDDARLGQQGVPVCRFDVLAGHQRRVHVRHAKGDDLAFQAHLHAVKRQRLCPSFLVFQCRQARIAAQISQYGVHANSRPGNRAVDAFGCQQQRALDVVGLATGEQWRLQGGVVRQLDKFVQRSGEKRHGGPALRKWVGWRCPLGYGGTAIK